MRGHHQSQSQCVAALSASSIADRSITHTHISQQLCYHTILNGIVHTVSVSFKSNYQVSRNWTKHARARCRRHNCRASVLLGTPPAHKCKHFILQPCTRYPSACSLIVRFFHRLLGIGRSRSRRWSSPHACRMLPAPRLNTGRCSTQLWTRRRGCIDNPAHESRPKRTRARLSPRWDWVGGCWEPDTGTLHLRRQKVFSCIDQP